MISGSDEGASIARRRLACAAIGCVRFNAANKDSLSDLVYLLSKKDGVQVKVESTTSATQNVDQVIQTERRSTTARIPCVPLRDDGLACSHNIL
jgi:hypothetical protein